MSMWTSFFGVEMGTMLHAKWNVFLGRAVENNPKVDIEAMRLSEQEIGKTVDEQQGAVAEFEAFAMEAEAMWKESMAADEKYTSEAKAAAKRGDTEGAKALLVEARSIRQILSNIENRASIARQAADNHRAELAYNKQQLKELRADLSNYEKIQKLDEAQRKVNKSSSSFSTEGAKRIYDKSADNVKRSAFTSAAESKLIEDPAKRAMHNARQAALDHGLDDELAQLMAPEVPKLIEEGQ